MLNLYTLLAALALAGGLTSWALLERSGRLDCKATAAALEGAYVLLADHAKAQSAAVADLEAKGAAARAQGRQAAIAAAADAKLKRAEIDALAQRLAVAEPAEKTCADALEVIRGRL